MSKPEAKKKARELRRSGRSYKQIAEELGVSKGSVSLWVGDILLSEKQKSDLPKSDGKVGGRVSQRIWEQRRREVKASYNPPMEDPDFILGLSLYWGEGSKHNESTVELTNSDPHILVYFVRWARKYFGAKSFSVRLQHHRPDDDDSMKKLWSKALKLPVTSFGKSTFLKTGSNRKRVCDGIVRVRVVGDGTWEVRQKIQRAIEILKNRVDGLENLR